MTLAASWLACLADAVTYGIFLPQVLGAKKKKQIKKSERMLGLHW